LKSQRSQGFENLKNSQKGDVVGLIDGSGHVLAEYEYDPYGKIVSITAYDALESAISVFGSIADKNPLRYRGY